MDTMNETEHLNRGIEKGKDQITEERKEETKDHEKEEAFKRENIWNEKHWLEEIGIA
jgi:hypothetical protein